MKKKKFFLLILFFFSLPFGKGWGWTAFSQCPTCQLPGWQYVKEITIDNSAISSSYTNYQELIILDTQTPISQGKMNASGNDLRFVDSDCSTQLCYFIESGINTANTKIWVKLPSLAANSTKTIFMFYGNSGAAAQSSFNCVFPNVLTVTGVVTLSGNQNYDWIDIQSGSTLNLIAGQILSFKARKIIMTGTINGNNKGYGAASGPGAGGNGGGGDGGGGGGYGGQGGSGKCPGSGSGSAYGTANGLDIDMGSGGGGSDCNPNGGGGGAVQFEAAEIDVSGNITMNGFTTGGSCQEEAAGGGSGGGILIYSDYVNGSGALSAIGGNGQNSQDKEGGGGGGGGRIKIFYCKENNFSGSTNVNRGSPGGGDQCSADDAQNGTSTVNIFVCETIAIGTEQFSTVANAGVDVAFCSGSTVTIGSASLSGYTYSWTPSSGLSDNDTSSPTVIITNNDSTNIVSNYILSATSNGCTVTDTVQITVYPLPTSDFTAVGPLCVDEDLIIQYTGNADTSLATFIWDFDNGNIITSSGQTYQVAWDTSGDKNIFLTVVQNGCLSSQQKIVVTVNPPNANAGPDVSFCSGNTIAIGTPAFPNYSYSWLPATGLSNDTVANPILTLFNTTQAPIPVDYIVTTSFAGCSHTDTVSVTVNPEPVSDAGQDINVFCAGNSALIGTLNNPDYTYSWSPATGLNNAAISSPTATLTNSDSIPLTQTYVVTTTFAAYGCTSSDSMNIIVYQIPTTNFSAPDSVCINEIVDFPYTGNATINASYQWNFGDGAISVQQNPSYAYSDSGTYTVTLNVTEICSSAAVTSFDIFVKPFPVSNAGNDTAYCSGNTATIGTTATAGYIYSWSPTFGLNDSIISNPTVNNTNNSQAPFVTDYIVTTILNNCISTDTVKVTVYQIPTSSFTLPTQLCGTENGTITYMGNATGAATYNWNFDAGIIVSGSGQGAYTIYWQTTSKKYISLSVTENGCSSTFALDSLIVFPIPFSYAGQDVSLCSGESFSLGVSSQSGYSYSWTPSDSLDNDTISNPTFSWTTTSNSIVSLQYIVTTSANNCVSSDTVQVTVVPNPDVNFTTADSTQCETGNNFSFFSSGTFLSEASFDWDFGTNAIPSSSTLQDVTGVSFQFWGTYPVTLTVSQYGCNSVSSHIVTVYKMPAVTPDVNLTEGCEPFPVNFYANATADTTVTYFWDFGDGKSDTLKNSQNTYFADGEYYVFITVTTAVQCSTTAAVDTITVKPKPDAAFSFLPEEITNLNPVVNFYDESSFSIKSWNWNFGDGGNSTTQNPIHSFPDTGAYFTTLIVFNAYNCSDTVTDTILILPDYNFFVPNAFSPNNDGQNDVFMPVAIGIDYSEFEMLIYNRWGELIFVTQSPKSPWEGTRDGKPVAEDVYVWLINLRDVFRKAHTYHGHVTVVR